MRIAIGTVTLALALALSFVQPACAQSQDQWDRLAELTVSENIELIDMSQRATQGRFAGYSREALLIDVAGRPTSISRKDVCMVNRLESSRRWRKIWLYSLAGAGTGAVIGALGWASTNERIGRDFLKNYSLVGVATGASMGAASRSEPLRFNVYRGTCAVEYRPDSFLPMMEIYGGFSLAAIETGATPAGGFEVGRPASARRVVSGGVFSMTFPVNEHLRLVAGEISVHSGDSGLTGLSKPARRVDGYYLMAGPEFTRRGNQWTLFGHLLAGFPITNLSTPGAAPTPIVLQGAPIPDRTTIFATDSGTALMIGGGADINISRWLAFRAGQLDFIRPGSAGYCRYW